ncbi:store-operated calcium entry-associated regulatory factor-like [Littorina saxatilis]|uniref:Store-operated calcium entry-associated regulatory factor n=1 Tax=Littorina saxatilis TaxID=31220 RepID=A0AAN9B928_9CAEN
MGQFGIKIVSVLLCTLVAATTFTTAAFGSNSDRVLLKEVSVLTLKEGHMTAGRRSSPVQQLNCVGGTAKGHFSPKVVQCYNRGSDGYDIQWECKADMDNAFRFGAVDVTCEGYEYPDDPYILKGSCGLEYTLEFTEEGHQRNKQQKSHSYGSHQHSDTSGYGSWGKKSSFGCGNLLFLGGVVVVIYVIYKTCLAPSAARDDGTGDGTPRPHTDRASAPPPPYGSSPPPPYGSSPPPPYGFRSDYMPGGDSCSGGATYGSSTPNTGTYAGPGTGNGTQGGGFWTGAATGGLLGYLFGRNNSYTQYQQPYGHQRQGWFSGWGSGSGSGWGSGSSGWGSTGFGGRSSYGGSSFGGGGGGGGSSFSSGTRTASGFGGTKRR